MKHQAELERNLELPLSLPVSERFLVSGHFHECKHVLLLSSEDIEKTAAASKIKKTPQTDN